MRYRSAVLWLLVLTWWGGGIAPAGAQPTVRASGAWATASTADMARVFATVENGTMYEVYITGAESDAADAVELVRMTDGRETQVKELGVAAFDRLEMSADGTFLKLTKLKRALKSGDKVTISLETENGPIAVDAVVK